MKYTIFYFFVSTLLIGCTQRYEAQQIDYSNYKTIDIDLKGNRYSQVEDFFEYESFIVLETNEDALIAKIDKVIINDGEIFILDTFTQSIFIYDESGKYLYKINKRGIGAGEYKDLSDFSYNSEKEIFILLDDSDGRLLFYDKKGDFIADTKVIPGQSFIQSSENWIFYLHNGVASSGRVPVFNNIIIYDSELNLESQYLPFPEPWTGRRWKYGETNSILTEYNNTIYIVPQESKYIYCFDEDEKSIKPVYHINFIGDTKIEINENSSKKDLDEYRNLISEHQMASCISEFSIKDDKMLFTYYYYDSKGTLVLIYDITTDKIYNCEFHTFRSNNYLPFDPVSYTSEKSDNRIMTIAKADYLCGLDEEKQNANNLIVEILKKIDYTEDTNPILVFYNYKDSFLK